MGMEVTPIRDFAAIGKMAAEGNLYVMNNTDMGNKRSRGNFSLEIKDEAGVSFPVVIPNTWLPINLAQYCEPTLFLKSNVFRNVVTNQNLVVISPEQAESILGTEAAAEEQRKNNEYIAGTQNAINNMSSNSKGEEKLTISTNSSRTTTDAPADLAKVGDDNELQRLVSLFNDGRVTEDHACDTLRTLSPSQETLKELSGQVNNTSSQFYDILTEMISNAPASGNAGPYRGPKPPAGLRR